MIFNLHQYRTAKVSNYQNLVERATSKFNEEYDSWNQVIKPRDFHFEITPIDLIKNCGKIFVIIHGTFPNKAFENINNVKNPCGSFDIEMGRWKFPEDLSKYKSFDDMIPLSKSELMGIFLHEITHVSQEISGFMRFDIKNTEKNPKVTHGDYKIEQEASFVELCSFIKEGYNKAVPFLIENPMAMNEGLAYVSSFREFVNKAYSLGVSKEPILQFLNLLDSTIKGGAKVTKPVIDFMNRINKSR